MKITFAAMRGIIGGREYYSVMMPLGTVPKMFSFTDWAEITPEAREQRVLNKGRIPVIASYMLENEKSYIFSSVVASYKTKVEFRPLADNGIGILEMDFEDAEFIVNDGQHRCAAIAAALKENPSLASDTISVLLFEYETLERTQQMFADLNRYVVKTPKGLNVLFDQRDPIARVAMKVTKDIPTFDGMVEKEAMSLPSRSNKLFTLSAFYEANRELLVNGEAEETRGEMESLAIEFWQNVVKALPEWEEIKEHQLKAMEYRQDYIASHAVILRAIGAAGRELIKAHPKTWQKELAKLSQVDFARKNKDWTTLGIVVANSVVSKRQTRDVAEAYLKQHFGLPLTDAEVRALSPLKADKPADKPKTKAKHA